MAPVEFLIDTAALPTPPGQRSGPDKLASFGLTELKGTFSTKGTWGRKDGRVVSDCVFDLTNVGKLTYVADVSGYTEELFKTISEMPATTDPANKDAAGMELLGLMQNVTLNAMSLRFDDASITATLIDNAATQSGQSREAIINQMKGMAPLLAIASQDVDFVNAFAEAVASYLDNPKSFEITMAPEKPVPLTLLMAVGMTDPKALIKQVGLQVLANQ
jgi:hypothetical protein